MKTTSRKKQRVFYSHTAGSPLADVAKQRITLFSPRSELAAHVQAQLGPLTNVQFEQAHSLASIPPHLLSDSAEAILLIDLSAPWPAADLAQFLERLSFGGFPRAELISILNTSDGYPIEWAALLHERLAGNLRANFHFEELEAILANGENRLHLRAGECEPTTLKGKAVRFDTRQRTIATMLDDIRMVAEHDVTVMLIGETGSGKTTLARLFHELSPRRNEAFIHVACGALPPTLIESELFGHVRGAFTGADRDKIGKFEVAGNGTLLLDEIDALDLDQQVKLLKVIETREFEPVGSHDTRIGQARLIVASNVCLEELVEQQRFRQDLYYRLNVLKFELPPLRERPLDVIPLAMDFLTSVARRCHSTIRSVHPGFLDALARYSWPGNLRELNHCMERAVVLCRDGKLFAGCLPQAILTGTSSLNGNSLRAVNTGHLIEKIADSERLIIEEVLRRHNFRRTSAAQELGVSRVTLYNKMKKYGL